VDRVQKNAATYAAAQGCADCLLALLEAGTPVNARLANQLTLLMWAAGQGQESTTKLLLEHGADAALRDDRGKTAADIAREAQHPEVLRILER
jgi:ankyrin repeat protein